MVSAPDIDIHTSQYSMRHLSWHAGKRRHRQRSAAFGFVDRCLYRTDADVLRNSDRQGQRFPELKSLACAISYVTYCNVHGVIEIR